MCSKIVLTLKGESGTKKCGAISFTALSLDFRLVYIINRFGVVDLVGVDTTFDAFRVDLRVLREYELWFPS